MTITKFITPYGTYTFATTHGDQEMKTNFSNLVPRVTRLPGTDGGFDEFGFSKAPSEVGSVQFGVVLESETTAGMQALRDSIKQMAAWGKGRLVDTINGVDRWCWARINSNDIVEQRHMHTDLFQPVKLTYQVSDPYWYTAGNGVIWGGGTWGSSTWGGSALGSLVTNNGTLTVTNNGSAPTLARIKINNTTVATSYNPIIRRLVGGTVVDEMTYNGSIAAGSVLDINPTNYTVKLDGVSVISNFTFTHPDWMRLLPGANALTFNLSGTVTVTVRYSERYF